jgi:hypothetical protein
MNEKELLRNLIEIRMLMNELAPDISASHVEVVNKIIRLTDIAVESYKKEISRVVE